MRFAQLDRYMHAHLHCSGIDRLHYIERCGREIGHTYGHAVEYMDALSNCAHNRAVKVSVPTKMQRTMSRLLLRVSFDDRTQFDLPMKQLR